MNVLKSLTLCPLSSCGSLCKFPFHAKEAPLKSVKHPLSDVPSHIPFKRKPAGSSWWCPPEDGQSTSDHTSKENWHPTQKPQLLIFHLLRVSLTAPFSIHAGVLSGLTLSRQVQVPCHVKGTSFHSTLPSLQLLHSFHHLFCSVPQALHLEVLEVG